MDKKLMASRRERLRQTFSDSGFVLKNERSDADEFRNHAGQYLYFYWEKGDCPNIAIDPHLGYAALLEISGVDLVESKHPNGLRFGAAMLKFPPSFEGVKPENSRSRVGRMMAVQESSLPAFLRSIANPVTTTSTSAFSDHPKELGASAPGDLPGNPFIPVDQDDTASEEEDGDKRLNGSKQPVTPEEDANRRLKQAENGALGEKLAMQYEIARLTGLRCPAPEQHVKQVSLEDVGAGYDIRSNWNGETRYIEVKASENGSASFFISSNEVARLTKLENSAWLYLIDLSQRTDLSKCVKLIRNPGIELAKNGVLESVQFRATLAI